MQVVEAPVFGVKQEFSVIGKSVSRRDGVEKVTGKADYAGDIKLPGMLYGKILRCPYAHAEVVSVDTTEAEKLPGVGAILTRGNTNGWQTRYRIFSEPAFPEEIVYAGQEVAAVAAEDLDTAQKALELIRVGYRILPIEINPKVPVGEPVVQKRGDIERGFGEADLIVEGTYSTSMQFQTALQTRTCLADWDGEFLTVWDAVQGVWAARKDLSVSLRLPIEKVRVICKYLGGGFGSKNGAVRISHYAAKLSMITGKPVRIEYTRREEFLCHPHRWAATMYLKTGVKRDGTLTAIYGRGVIAAGNKEPGRIFANEVLEIPWELYQCPNVHLEQITTDTNENPTGCVRGVLHVIGTFFTEAHMDEVAEKLHMDPVDFKLKNYTIYADQEKMIGYSSKNLDRCIRLVTDAVGWRQKRALASNNKGATKKRGIGLATYFYHGVGWPPYEASARLVIRPDGSLTLVTGVVDHGGGHSTTLPMIAAEVLGVRPSDITMTWGDTEGTEYAPTSHASRLIAEMGPAVMQAASEAKLRLFEKISSKLGVEPGLLESKDGFIFSRADGSKSLPFRDACRMLDETITTKGNCPPVPADVRAATFGAQAVEVEVDVETGKVRVVRVASAHELGRALNPKMCDSQHYGGIMMGLGYALSEEGVYDKKTGIMLNPDLHQYRTPTPLETPEILVFNVEAEDPYFAYSAKGVGEGPTIPTAAAIRNAVHDAIGVWINDLPITPDRILNALYSD